MINGISVALCLIGTIFLSSCISQDDGGRGYRYKQGGNYIGSNPSFSPDGNKIVFGSLKNDTLDIYVANSDGTGLKRLTDTHAYEGEPEFSPDGSRIVFVSEKDSPSHGEIYTMNADGGEQKRLTVNDYYDFEPSFSHDGSMIVFCRQIDKYETDIIIVNVDGTGERRLTYSKGLKGNPNFTKDNNIRYTVFNLDTQEKEIYQMNNDGSGSMFLMKMAKESYDEAYSEDGNRIVYISSRMTDYTIDPITKTEVFVMNSDGSEAKQLTNSKTYKSHPTFSPDGRKILFLSEESEGRGRGQIMTMNIDGTNLRVITKNY